MLTAKVSEYRSQLGRLHKQIIEDSEILRVSGNSGDVVVLSADEFENLQETLYVLKDKTTMASILETRAAIGSGNFEGEALQEVFSDLGA